MKLTARVKIKNPLGLHARPATAIAKLLLGTKSSVLFTYRKDTVNARSIMSVLMLAATKNSMINITVDGEDAEFVLKLLIDAFNNGFGELPPKSAQ